MSNVVIASNWKLPDGFRFSQANLQDFTDCERRFYLRYIEQQRWPSPLAEPQDMIEKAMQRGARFHQLVERHQVGVDLDTIYQSAEDDEALGRWLNHYQAALQKFGTFDQQWAEVSLSSFVGDYPVMARYDFVGVQSQHLMAVDWKTGRLPDVVKLEQRLQSSIYRLILFNEGAKLAQRPIDQFTLYYIGVNDGEQRQFSVDATIAHRLETQLQNIIQQVVQAKTFPLTEDENKCRFCVYRGLCERGQTQVVNDMATLDTDDLWLDIEQSDLGEVEF